MTHKVNPEETIRIAKEEDMDRRHLIALKIKPQLSMLRKENFQMAYEKLLPRYEKCFNKKLKVKRKLADGSKK